MQFDFSSTSSPPSVQGNQMHPLVVIFQFFQFGMVRAFIAHWFIFKTLDAPILLPRIPHISMHDIKLTQGQIRCTLEDDYSILSKLGHMGVKVVRKGFHFSFMCCTIKGEVEFLSPSMKYARGIDGTPAKMNEATRDLSRWDDGVMATFPTGLIPSHWCCLKEIKQIFFVLDQRHKNSSSVTLIFWSQKYWQFLPPSMCTLDNSRLCCRTNVIFSF